MGLNPALTELKRWWDAGQLAVVQGIGYPNADFSHFNSMAYWMSGQVGGIPSTGWLGRWLDGYLGGGRDLFAAAEVGYSVPLHLIGANQRGTVVPTSKPAFGTGTDSSDAADVPGDAEHALRQRTDRGMPRSARRSSINSTWRRRSPGIIRPTTHCPTPRSSPAWRSRRG